MSPKHCQCLQQRPVTVVGDVKEEARFELILEHAWVNLAHDIDVCHGADPGRIRHQVELARALCHATLSQYIEQNLAANGGTDGSASRRIVHVGDIDTAVAVVAGQDMDGGAFACDDGQRLTSLEFSCMH